MINKSQQTIFIFFCDFDRVFFKSLIFTRQFNEKVFNVTKHNVSKTVGRKTAHSWIRKGSLGGQQQNLLKASSPMSLGPMLKVCSYLTKKKKKCYKYINFWVIIGNGQHQDQCLTQVYRVFGRVIFMLDYTVEIQAHYSGSPVKSPACFL